MDIASAAEAATQFMRKHPYCTLAVACLLSGVFFRPGAPKLLSGAGAMLAIAGILVLTLVLRPVVVKLFRRQPLLLGLCALAAALSISGFFLGRHPAVYLFVFGLFLVWMTAQSLMAKNALQTWQIALFFVAASFILHLMYILYVPYYSFQHDLGESGGFHGHLPYIEYFFTNQFHIPDFDLRDRFGFQNPPLHHFVAAIWLKVATTLSYDYGACLESLQILTLFYSGWVTLTGYKLLRELDLDGPALLVPFAIICAHPALVIFSGLLNNDVLCLALTMQAAVFALRWYKKPATGTIIKIALCIGLAMLTKSSGAMVAPAVAFLFLARLIQGGAVSRQKLMGQFVVFGLICIPLGLWWHVYYLLKFGTPMFYVPFQGYESDQYVGYYPMVKRLFDLAPYQFKNMFHNWGDPYFEYSIPVAILKTSAFGEFDFSYNTYVPIPAHLLFFSNAALIILASAATAVGLFARQSAQSRIVRVFLVIFYLAVFGSYVKFCFDYPHSCTMNYRYIVPTCIIGCCFLGFALQKLYASAKPLAKVLRTSIVATAGIFCFSSCLFYMAVGLAF